MKLHIQNISFTCKQIYVLHKWKSSYVKPKNSKSNVLLFCSLKWKSMYNPDSLKIFICNLHEAWNVNIFVHTSMHCFLTLVLLLRNPNFLVSLYVSSFPSLEDFGSFLSPLMVWNFPRIYLGLELLSTFLETFLELFHYDFLPLFCLFFWITQSFIIEGNKDSEFERYNIYTYKYNIFKTWYIVIKNNL